MSDVVDLLAALREGTRRGAGREVDVTAQPQALEASGTVTDPSDDGKPDATGARISREQATRKRLYDGTFTDADVAWIRERLKTPRLLTKGQSCADCDCRFAGQPVRYGKAIVAPSRCALDDVCWKAENDAAEIADQRPPLWRLRLPNGKPNYIDLAEQNRYLHEAGWLAWSRGDRKGPAAGVAATSGARTQKKAEWPVSWETYTTGDARRVPPADANPSLLADWQLAYIESAPIERLAEVSIGPSPWRHWEGEQTSPADCAVCGETANYSVGGARYCRSHAKDAEVAQKRGVPIDELVEVIEIEEREVAA